MKEFLAVFIGGGFGSLARYGLSKSMSGFSVLFPFGTFSANLLSCIIAGLTISFIEEKIFFSSLTKNFLIVGFCGGFSTFSTFIREIIVLNEHNKAGPMIAYALLSVILGLVGMVSGLWIGKMIIR
jgi:CrcB protein